MKFYTFYIRPVHLLALNLVSLFLLNPIAIHYPFLISLVSNCLSLPLSTGSLISVFKHILIFKKQNRSKQIVHTLKSPEPLIPCHLPSSVFFMQSSWKMQIVHTPIWLQPHLYSGTVFAKITSHPHVAVSHGQFTVCLIWSLKPFTTVYYFLCEAFPFHGFCGTKPSCLLYLPSSASTFICLFKYQCFFGVR